MLTGIRPITPLSDRVKSQVRSNFLIPTIPSLVTELLHNSLDAGATTISVYLDLSTPGSEIIRVEDDGSGISQRGLKEIGRRYSSSKQTSGLSGSGSLGYRGEALASIAALGMLEITTKTSNTRDAQTKIIRDSQTIYDGISSRSLPGAHGTTIIVKDLFHSIPARQNSSTATAFSILSACKRMIEGLSLVRPRVRWNLWEERQAGPSSAKGSKRILGIQGAASSLEAYRGIHGIDGVKDVYPVNCESGPRRMQGFISLEGSVHKSRQHLYVNGYPLDRGDLHLAIARRFNASRFSVMAQDSLAETEGQELKRRSPRRLERYPIYVLCIVLPPGEVDTTYEPSKRRVGYKDYESVQALVLSAVDDFLISNGFSIPRKSTPARKSLETRTSPLHTPRALSTRPVTPLQQLLLRSAHRRSPIVSTSPSMIPIVDRTLPATMPILGKRRTEYPKVDDPPTARKRSKWIDKLIADVAPAPKRDPTPSKPCTYLSHSIIDAPTDLTFTEQSIRSARIIGQVDKKYICCVLDSTVCLIDQHAADERVSVESILQDLCYGFMGDCIDKTEMTTTPTIVLCKSEGEILVRPEVTAILNRWGIHCQFDAGTMTSDYVQITITSVPTALISRLGRKEGSEMTRLLKVYLPILDRNIGEIEALLFRAGEDPDWGRALRWMPKEMLELANSKACRGAIMFEDVLNHDQCARLVNHLARTRFPFMCAHGRPSLVPLLDLGRPSNYLASRSRSGRRRIAWSR